MLGFRKKKELVDRPENEPKFNIHNKTDRKLFFTLFGVGAVCVVILIGLIILVSIG